MQTYMYRNEELDLGSVKPKEGGPKKMDFLLKKIQDKKQSSNSAIE